MLVFFPIVVGALPKDGVKRGEKKLWMQLAYLLRAYNLSNKEFKPLDKNHLKKLAVSFYWRWANTFGEYSCIYNVHLIHHLDAMREKGPFCTTSAFRSEGYFGEMAYKAGTTSIGTQIFTNTYLKNITGHRCTRTPRLAPTKSNTPKTRDDLFYTFEQRDEEYKFYVVVGWLESGNMQCHPIVSHGYFDSESGLFFGKVGVNEYVGFSEMVVEVIPSIIAGKALRVANLIIAIPNIVLNECS